MKIKLCFNLRKITQNLKSKIIQVRVLKMNRLFTAVIFRLQRTKIVKTMQ